MRRALHASNRAAHLLFIDLMLRLLWAIAIFSAVIFFCLFIMMYIFLAHALDLWLPACLKRPFSASQETKLQVVSTTQEGRPLGRHGPTREEEPASACHASAPKRDGDVTQVEKLKDRSVADIASARAVGAENSTPPRIADRSVTVSVCRILEPRQHDTLPDPSALSTELVLLYFNGVGKLGPPILRRTKIRQAFPSKAVKGLMVHGLNDIEMLLERASVTQVSLRAEALGMRQVAQSDPLTFVSSGGQPLADDDPFVAIWVGDTLARWDDGAKKNRHGAAREWYGYHANMLRIKCPQFAKM